MCCNLGVSFIAKQVFHITGSRVENLFVFDNNFITFTCFQKPLWCNLNFSYLKFNSFI